MKFDKQNMIKNRFWLLLGGFGFFSFIGFATLLFGDPLGTQKKDYDQALKSVKDTKDVKHEETYVPPWNKQTEAFKAHKEKAWELAWESQKTLLTWPEEGLRVRWEKGAGKDLKSWVEAQKGDKLLTDELRTYASDRYRTQFDKPYEWITPARFFDGKRGYERMMAPATASDTGNKGGSMPPPPVMGGGPAGGGGGGGREIKDVWVNDRNAAPTLEEAWIAQEDFCVKRELLRALGATIKSAARMDPGPAGFWQGVAAYEPPATGDVRHYRCHNGHWELDLVLSKTGPNGGWVLVRTESMLKNVDVERRMLNVASVKDPDRGNPNGTLRFRVYRKGDKGDAFVTIEVRGESLPWDASVKLSAARKASEDGRPATSPPTEQPAEVKDFVAPDDIKEVVEVLDWEMSPIRVIEEIRVPCLSQRMADLPLKPGLGFYEKKEEPPAAAAPQGSSESSGVKPPPGGPRAPGAPGGTGAASTAVPPTDPNRLDRLRYLHVTEQSRHLPFGVALVVEKNAVPGVLAALANTPLRVQSVQYSVQRVRGVALNPAVNAPILAGTQDDDANLVELSIYGICTLYERVPDKAEKDKTEKAEKDKADKPK